MNRLWVRISLIIALVAVIITLFPLAVRRLGMQPERFNPTAVEQEQPLSPEEVSKIRADFGNRIWWLTWERLLLAQLWGWV